MEGVSKTVWAVVAIVIVLVVVAAAIAMQKPSAPAPTNVTPTVPKGPPVPTGPIYKYGWLDTIVFFAEK